MNIESDDIIYTRKDFAFEHLSRLSINIKKLKEIPQFLLSETLVDIYIASSLLNTIPNSTFQNLKRLSYLSIQAPIKEMVKLSHCLNLIALNLVFTKLTNLDINELLPSNLQQLFLIRNELLSEELNFSTLQKLQTLRINNDENITPTRLIGISCCINLKNLELTFVENFPDELEKCKKLQAIFINKGKMNSLPDWFVNFEHLSNINICHTKLRVVPKNWSNLKNLGSLYLNNNKLEDLSFVYTTPKLKYVRFDGNQIKDSLFMLDKGKIFPVYHKEWFELKALPAKDIPSFMSAIGKSGMDRTDKEWFFYQFQSQAKFTLPTNWPLYRYFQGLSIPYKLLNQNITNFLIETPLNKQGLDTLVAGSVCFLDGNFTEKKTTIKEKLDTLNIKVSTTLNTSVTHLIIGQKPSESVLHYQQQEIPFLLEYQLYQIIKNVGQEEKFLVQEEIAGDTQMAEGLKQLLGSNDLSSVQIGLEMLKTGGIPGTISEELLLLCKTFNDAKVRAEARKILEVQAQVEWVGILKDKQTFINISQTKEKDLRDKLQKMAATIGKEQVFSFAMLLYKYYEKGLAFVLANFALGSKERIAALNALTTGDHFNFHKGIGYHNWKNQRPDEIILSSVSTGIAFPSDHPNPKQIKSINMHNCKFETLNKGIEVFENVEELCLSVNNLKALNPSIAKLQHLKVLDLSSNRLTAFPKAVEGLTNLRVLDLRYNSQYAYKDGQPISIEIPEWAKEKLSNCEILI
ncbi:leucine-rich repeat domain-containing protein [Emticicia sp.]|uniref:leucine-rich repeat domain-containing protein n=1 Tax=Emticicia sp. TaxID=1930953 RepID=UPI003BA87484